jgi:endo-1,4-beta-xylanase
MKSNRSHAARYAVSLQPKLFLVLLAVAPVMAQTLRDLGDQRGIHIGAAADPSYFSEADYKTTLGRQFNQLQAENVMKFGPIHPGLNTYNFDPADQLVAFAAANSMAVRGHTLVWYQQNPTWLTGGAYTPTQLSDILQDHINTVVGHFGAQVYAWDVVNEAFNDDGTIRSTIWSDSPGIGLGGTAYIEQAFRWAHAADPSALLFYNDYNNSGINAKSDAIYKMAQDFLARGVPLHGIGLQMHLSYTDTDLSGIEPNIKRFTDLGLQVQFTEMDVRLPVDSSDNATPANLAVEAQIYQSASAICLTYPLCTAIQTWGFTDKHSWIPGFYPGYGAALEFDQNYQPKPAFTAMQSALQTSPPVLVGGGLGNAANYASAAVSPGEIVVLFGPTAGPAALAVAQADANGNLPTRLSGVRLLFDGVAAPLLYARVGQVSAVVPFGVAGNATTRMQYEYQDVQSNAVSMNVVPTVPGLFTLDSSGSGPAAILDLNYHVISAGNPAHHGDIIQVYATGAGVTSPPSVDGQASAAGPFPIPVAHVTARIGGVDCPVLYAGGASGLVAGGLQVNLRIAAGVPLGAQPVVLTIGGVDSQPNATVLVQ